MYLSRNEHALLVTFLTNIYFFFFFCSFQWDGYRYDIELENLMGFIELSLANRKVAQVTNLKIHFLSGIQIKAAHKMQIMNFVYAHTTGNLEMNTVLTTYTGPFG